MALQQRTVLDRIEILPRTGHIQVRLAEEIFDDAQPAGVISASYLRRVFDPGEFESANALLGDLAPSVTGVWTPAVIERWAAFKKGQAEAEAQARAQIEPGSVAN